MQGTGWLVVGAVGAVAVAASGMASGPGGMAPRAGWALAALAIGAALYFRSHWAALAREHRTAVEERSDRERRLARLADDIDRSAFVIADNLEEVAAEGRARLFLDGARAHARGLGNLAARCRGLASRPAADAASTEPDADD